MTLTTQQRRTASQEVHADLQASTLALANIARDRGLSPERVRLALSVAVHADGSDVWLVRDYLAQAVRDIGATPVDHSVLSETTRRRARQWYAMHEPPHHDFNRGHDAHP
ncbi:hypothetical protein AKG07_09780 [Microbacterium sp. CGR1]|uniref:DUF2316 family protein n=1 Tax=Microbacterium sp. CGR1 TaxID=1696072 RepID=UPI0006A29D4C|nr:DUF2316 family protein [Microbacterium sp. CGR1]AKV88046.1 hypothetical protein AKG07_09780 [Microbacterium sp. CGR1]